MVWSPDGAEPYRPWPPRAWDERAAAGSAVTPYVDSGRFGDSVFITVEKEGYRRPQPQLAQLYTFRTPKLRFELEELPETFTKRMQAEGKVFYEGRWVDPRTAGLVLVDGTVLTKAEAFRREQAEKGLVEYEGAWLTPAERDKRLAAARAKEGLVALKGRWVTPEEARHENETDAAIAAIRNNASRETLEVPRSVGRAEGQLASLQLFNNSPLPVTFRLGGPSSRSIEVPAYRSVGLQAHDQLALVPGNYALAVEPHASDPRTTGAVVMSRLEGGPPQPAFVEARLETGRKYALSYLGRSRPEVGGNLSYQPRPVELPQVAAPVEVPPLEPLLTAGPENATTPTLTNRQGPPGGQRRPGGGRPRR